ncbi:MAG TPA: hypothetical protein GXZ28_01460 [Clostridiales bacterium]|nr:hypothetical protein [Clostridiales bacterium]
MFSNKKRYHLLLIILLFLLGNIPQTIQAKSDDTLIIGKVENHSFETVDVVERSITNDLYWYSASVAPISEFFDPKGNLNTIYETEKSITLVKYNDNFTDTTSYTIKKPYPLFGGAICDSEGNYYIVYGQENDTDDESKVVLSVVKYNSEFKYQSEVKYTGLDTRPYSGQYWGTKVPFRSGNCDIALNGNVLVCSYARRMYNGHQSNHVIFVNTTTMTKLNYAGCYTSHSFDQRVIVTSDRNYLFADHGDAFDRGFKLSKVINGSTNIRNTREYVSFHFREGSNRDYGYNETYAQLGGIAELSTGYVLAAASEKTLSLEPASTSRSYCGHSEARNLFIQIIHKNFPNLNRDNTQILKTDVRTTTGKAPSDALTPLYLSGYEKDYGVLWLTDYSDEYCVVNPKLIATDDDRIILMWEKFKYAGDYQSEKYVDTYYMILSSDGSILQEAIPLHGIRLTAHETPVYRDQKVYWTTTNGYDAQLELHILHLGETDTLKNINSLSIGKIANQKWDDDQYYVTPDVVIKSNGKVLKKDIDYILDYDNNDRPGKATVIITGIGKYYGTKEIDFYIAPGDVEITLFYSPSKGSFYYNVDYISYFYCDGIEVEYSTDWRYSTKTVLKKPYGTVKKLKSKKTYYLRARSYIEVDGKKIYGSYCKMKKVKVK